MSRPTETILWFYLVANVIYISNFNTLCKLYNKKRFIQISYIITDAKISDLVFWSTKDGVIYLNAHKDFLAHI